MLLIKIISLGLIATLLFDDGGMSIQKKAKEEHKNIVVYFCGSDWCTVCHKFKNTVLADKKIDSLLLNNYIYYVADFPQRKKQSDTLKAINEALAEKLNKEGSFPKLVITNEQLSIKAVIKSSESNEAVFEKLKANQ